MTKPVHSFLPSPTNEVSAKRALNFGLPGLLLVGLGGLKWGAFPSFSMLMAATH